MASIPVRSFWQTRSPAYLPAAFLAEIGLPQPSGAEVPGPISEGDKAGDDAPVDPDASSGPLSEAHPSLALPADALARRSAAQVWQVAWESLRYELSRPVFETHLAGCSLASFDPADTAFNIAVPDEQSRLWLQDRLSIQLSRLLAGICDRPCRVHFVPYLTLNPARPISWLKLGILWNSVAQLLTPVVLLVPRSA